MSELSHLKGKLITFEGIEGVGKSTQVQHIAKQLKKSGLSVTVTREPGGTEVAEEIRKILLANRSEKVMPTTELLLLFAARAQHIEHVITPKLRLGHCVLCDRFTDASYAYQGGGRGIDLVHIARLESFVQGNLQPFLTMVLDAPIEIGLERAKGRGEIDRIEQEELAFFQRVRNVYLERAKNNPAQYYLIDAAKSLFDVQQSIMETIKEHVGLSTKIS